METRKNSFTKTNSFIMDLIRIAAAWGVLIGHAFSMLGLTRFKDEQFFPYIQNIGVVLLVILAGFFTAFSLEKKSGSPNYTFGKFIVGKILRIYSAFIPAIIFVAVIDKINMTLAPQMYFYSAAYNIKTFVGNLFQLQDIFFVTSFGSARPFWTLAAECWLYAAAGYIYLTAVPKIKNNSLGLKELFILPVITLPCVIHLLGGGRNTLAFMFVLGIVIYLLYDRVKISEAFAFVGSVFWLFVTIAVGLYYKNAYCVPFVLAAAMTILFLMIYGRLAKPARYINAVSKAAAFLSNYTYSLFLIHYSIFVFLLNVYGFLPKWTLFIIGAAASNVLAIIFSLLFERAGKVLAKKYAARSEGGKLL